MGLALYRKYRSTSLEELKGQDHIVTTIKNMVKKSDIPHAYLLTGPRGVGKTSAARLMSCMINGIDYNTLDSQVDIIEIDAASNRKIDEIREIREQVNIVPTSLKYKIYIVDEVHMLTKEAFNALLKTLEEPPEHVIFILATTEFHKLPPTIISRCLRFNFKTIPENVIADHLKFVADEEKIKIDDQAIALIAKHSDGSFRDGLTLLENFKHMSGQINKKAVEDNLGLAGEELIEQITNAVESDNKKSIYDLINDAEYQGVNFSILASSLADYYREKLINNPGSKPSETVILLDDLLDVKVSIDPKQKLVLSLIRYCTKNEPMIVPSDKKKAEIEPPVAKNVVEELIPAEPANTQMSANDNDINSTWEKTLEELKKDQNTVYAIARMGQIIDFNNDKLILECKFPFHAKRLGDDKNKALLIKVLNKHHKTPIINIEFKIKSNPEQKTTVTNISNIFGEAEVIE